MGLLPSWERNVTGFYIVTRVIQHMWSPCVCASLQVSPTLCKLMGYSLPDSTVHGILQARILEWVAIPSSSRSSQPREGWTSISGVFCIVGGFFFFFLITSAIYVERLYFQIKPYSLHWGLDVSLREHNSTHNNGNSHGELTSEGCHINGAIKGKQWHVKL